MTLTDAEVAIAAALAGAEVVVRNYGADHVRFAKSATDFATNTDLDAEAAIVRVLARHRPADPCTGEETGGADSEAARRRWLIDPLCGTLNFAATTPLVAVNVALLQDGIGRAAASTDPIAGEVFWTDGSAACLRAYGRDRPLAPSAVSGLIEINCDGPLDRPFVGGQLVHDPHLRGAYGPRVISSTLGVAWVAAGRRAAYVSDGTFRENLHFAAGIAIAEAAGCAISDLAGNPLNAGRGFIVSADAATHQAVLALVEPHLEAVIKAG
ncbi:inositol monophosphatase family protein [Micromonospora sp. WMMD1082]|uniref:inositol monophosphatase family protein n=1 Tax=Micromonospora sp. WMMD1082 TaxID=3016104 RepID=UPI002416F13D|nr:inositol monophosphatase family protein [Micromonospora sp. WMMD1082]MDG4797791.1 inositol monophosphatase family protein [Micromonospora sp. WMMD1082]